MRAGQIALICLGQVFGKEQRINLQTHGLGRFGQLQGLRQEGGLQCPR
jgi:hypothetical protein